MIETFKPAFLSFLILFPFVRVSVSTSPTTIFLRFVFNNSSAHDGDVSVCKQGSSVTNNVSSASIRDFFIISISA